MRCGPSANAIRLHRRRRDRRVLGSGVRGFAGKFRAALEEAPPCLSSCSFAGLAGEPEDKKEGYAWACSLPTAGASPRSWLDRMVRTVVSATEGHNADGGGLPERSGRPAARRHEVGDDVGRHPR